MSTERWREILRRVAAPCAAAGLDLAHPFSVARYNAVVDTAYRLPDFDRPAAFGLLIGNTRALWPHFRAALAAEPALRDAADPIEHYTAGRVRTVLAEVPERTAVRFAHDPFPHVVAMQRLAHVSGLAYLSASGLNVHARYGPWIALRAAVVVDIDGPQEPPGDPPNPCLDCARTCAPALARAMASVAGRGADGVGLGETWPLWLAVRDACPVGREHRYGDEQIAYHYIKDRRILGLGV